MNIKLSKKDLGKIDSDIELLVVKDLKKLSKSKQKLLKKISFDLKSFDTYFDANTNIFFVSCPKLKKEDLKLCFSSAIRSIKKLNIKSIKLDLIQNEKELDISEIVEGLVLGNYEFTKYK
jgi:leucyl aminopeptidase